MEEDIAFVVNGLESPNYGDNVEVARRMALSYMDDNTEKVWNWLNNNRPDLLEKLEHTEW